MAIHAGGLTMQEIDKEFKALIELFHTGWKDQEFIDAIKRLQMLVALELATKGR